MNAGSVCQPVIHFLDCQQSIFGQSAGKLITCKRIKTSSARLEQAIELRGTWGRGALVPCGLWLHHSLLIKWRQAPMFSDHAKLTQLIY